ncbi:14843_t:CDS:2, partial [Gigaspora rosea]
NYIILRGWYLAGINANQFEDANGSRKDAIPGTISMQVIKLISSGHYPIAML